MSASTARAAFHRLELPAALSRVSSSWSAGARGGVDGLHRRFVFASFSAAWGWMSRVALAAEAADHHPEWSNVYATVDVRLTTHDARGVTEKDVALARQMDAFAADFAAAPSSPPLAAPVE